MIGARVRLAFRQGCNGDGARGRESGERQPILHQLAGAGMCQFERVMAEAVIEAAFPRCANGIARLKDGPLRPSLSSVNEPRPFSVMRRENFSDRRRFAMGARRKDDAVVGKIHEAIIARFRSGRRVRQSTISRPISR